MNKIEQLYENLKFENQSARMDDDYKELKGDFGHIKTLSDSPGEYCQIQELTEIFSWKRGFAYLFTGSPNTGKSTMVLYLYLLMAMKAGKKFAIWSPEMEDAYLVNKKANYHVRDIIYMLIWTITGITPFESYSRKHQSALMPEKNIADYYHFICDHFKFIHLNNRTPDALIRAFADMKDKYDVDGFLIDPWKAVKQVMTTRSDLWMEDTLMSFKEFALEANAYFSYVVHPKSLKDYRDDDGQLRVITPFDLNGGQAWFNSMDVIISLRRLEHVTEWYTFKARKQHLVGKTGDLKSITFSMDNYRFYFNGNDPLK